MTTMRWWRRILFAVFLVSGCDSAAPPESGPDAAVARVNDTVLTMGDMTAEMQTAMLPVATSQMKQEWVQKWIQSELLYQEALRLNLNENRKTARELQRMQRDYLANVLLERVLSGDSLTVTEADIKRYYDDNQQEFIRQEPERHLSVIVLQNEKAARDVWRDLSRDRSRFGEIARTTSIDVASAQHDGDLGFLKPDDISDADFRDLVFSMKVGELSRPVLTESGYCIINVVDGHEIGSVKDLEEVRGEITNRVLEERRRDKVKRLLDGLRQEALVEVDRFHLIEQADGDSSTSSVPE